MLSQGMRGCLEYLIYEAGYGKLPVIHVDSCVGRVWGARAHNVLQGAVEHQKEDVSACRARGPMPYGSSVCWGGQLGIAVGGTHQ